MALAQVGGVVGGPAPAMDRPQKQADYAALSHPANTKTVMARTTVDDPVPLQRHQESPQYAHAPPSGFYGGGHAGFYY